MKVPPGLPENSPPINQVSLRGSLFDVVTNQVGYPRETFAVMSNKIWRTISFAIF
jgi:hypothetical protein